MGIPFSCFHSLQSFLLPFGATVCQHCHFEQEYSLVRVLFLLSVRICKHGGCGRRLVVQISIRKHQIFSLNSNKTLLYGARRMPLATLLRDWLYLYCKSLPRCVPGETSAVSNLIIDNTSFFAASKVTVATLSHGEKPFFFSLIAFSKWVVS